MRLLVAAAAPTLVARAGSRVSLRYLSSAEAAATLTVSRAGKRVARVRGTARAGANTIRWSGKSGREAARAGRYTLTLRAVAADGQVSSATAKLTLRRPR